MEKRAQLLLGLFEEVGRRDFGAWLEGRTQATPTLFCSSWGGWGVREWGCWQRGPGKVLRVGAAGQGWAWNWGGGTGVREGMEACFSVSAAPGKEK